MPATPYAPAQGDLYDRTVRMAWQSSLAWLPVMVALPMVGGGVGWFLAGPLGVITGIVAGMVVDLVLSVRQGGSSTSYRRMREPMLRELGSHYATDFTNDWRVGYARGMTRAMLQGATGDDSEDFGFLRMLPDRLEFYGVRTTFLIPAEFVTEAGLAHCSKALFLSLFSLSFRRHRPYVTYRAADGFEYSYNFELMDGGSWPGMMARGEQLGEHLGSWLAAARGHAGALPPQPTGAP